jgi:hypothetical protein
MLLGACGTQPASVDPAVARYSIAALLPAGVADRDGWAEDIRVAFHALDIEPTAQNICAVVAVTQQESSFVAQPVVPGLADIARREIESRAASHGVPRLLVRGALRLSSPTGISYEERLRRVRTEKELSDLFEDFIGRVPLGSRLFGGFNPVRTGGPMQVSIAFAQEHADSKRYPYGSSPNVRHEVFTRRGGMYFGIAHLLDYPVPYDRMLYRFADFNAGHYASRNAAFQSAVASLAKTKLALDGDLLVYGAALDAPGQTERALRKLAGRLEMDDAQIRNDLERGREAAFDRTKVYERVFALADAAAGRAVPRATTPRIKLQSAKITRNLTTEWFATRVDQRYRACLGRGSAAT